MDCTDGVFRLARARERCPFEKGIVLNSEVEVERCGVGGTRVTVWNDLEFYWRTAEHVVGFDEIRRVGLVTVIGDGGARKGGDPKGIGFGERDEFGERLLDLGVLGLDRVVVIGVPQRGDAHEDAEEYEQADGYRGQDQDGFGACNALLQLGIAELVKRLHECGRQSMHSTYYRKRLFFAPSCSGCCNNASKRLRNWG